MYRDVKEIMQDSVGLLAPDMYKQIESRSFRRIESEDELFGELNRKKEKKSRPSLHSMRSRVLYPVFAACLLLLVLVGYVDTKHMISGEVFLDVNPSIAFSLNKKGTVVDVKALNEDAKAVVSNIRKKGKLQDVMQDAFDSLEKNGYINDDHNEVLITYCYKKENKKVEASLNTAVASVCESDKASVNVIYQSFKQDKNYVKKAKESGVSVGKYYFVEQLGAQYDVDANELLSENIHEICTKVGEGSIEFYSPDNKTTATEVALDGEETVSGTALDTAAQTGTEALSTDASATTDGATTVSAVVTPAAGSDGAIELTDTSSEGTSEEVVIDISTTEGTLTEEEIDDGKTTEDVDKDDIIGGGESTGTTHTTTELPDDPNSSTEPVEVEEGLDAITITEEDMDQLIFE